jgi:hypothetical protein
MRQELHYRAPTVPTTIGPNGLPLPRSLKTVDAIQRELTSLYRSGKGGEIEPVLLGRLVHCLHVLLGSMRDHSFEARIIEIERMLQERGIPLPGNRPNSLGVHLS